MKGLFVISGLLMLAACAVTPRSSQVAPVILYKAETHEVRQCTSDGYKQAAQLYWQYRNTAAACIAAAQQQGFQRLQ